jgi:hypothetical protein
MMPDKQEGGSALHPSTVERLRRCIDAHPRNLFGDQFPITRKFAEEVYKVMSETRSLSLREALEDAVEVASNYYALFHDETWKARLEKWRDALRAQEPPPEEDGKLTRCLFCHADLGACEHTKQQWDVVKEPPQAQWQPIETAPSDKVLLGWSSEWACGMPEMVIWLDGFRIERAGWHTYQGHHRFVKQPTHWKPLGDTPVSAERST